jgi:agmatinase
MDVVEVAPPYDVAEITAAAAHRCVMEAISALAVRRRAEGREAGEGLLEAGYPERSGGG